MSVAKYYPFNGERGRLRLGLSAIEFSEWIQYEDDFATRIQENKVSLKTKVNESWTQCQEASMRKKNS